MSIWKTYQQQSNLNQKLVLYNLRSEDLEDGQTWKMKKQYDAVYDQTQPNNVKRQITSVELLYELPEMRAVPELQTGLVKSV